jgi:creatinine amidohydrolase
MMMREPVHRGAEHFPVGKAEHATRRLVHEDGAPEVVEEEDAIVYGIQHLRPAILQQAQRIGDKGVRVVGHERAMNGRVTACVGAAQAWGHGRNRRPVLAQAGCADKYCGMPSRPWILAESTWKTVASTPYAVAVLPWGATEAHNYHLPYATDSMQCEALAAESARLAWERGARVVVLPCVPFGVNTGQLDIKLCLNMNPATQAALLADLVHAIEGQGIRKLVIFNGHGGNDFRQMIRELQARTTVFLSTLNWYKVGDPTQIFTDHGDHAGELETSVMLHVAPELVRPLHEAGDGAEKHWRIAAMRDGWAWAPRRWTEISADTGVGNPALATAEKGARYAAEVTQQVAGFLVELAAADVNDLYDSGAH